MPISIFKHHKTCFKQRLSMTSRYLCGLLSGNEYLIIIDRAGWRVSVLDSSDQDWWKVSVFIHVVFFMEIYNSGVHSRS